MKHPAIHRVRLKPTFGDRVAGWAWWALLALGGGALILWLRT